MGRPKALIELPTGGTMIEHAVWVARQVTDEVVVLGREIRLPASLAKLTILDDAKPDGGPLAGLCSLLKRANRGWGLLLACDMPYIKSAVIRRLLAQADPDTDAPRANLQLQTIPTIFSVRPCRGGLFRYWCALGTALPPATRSVSWKQ